MARAAKSLRYATKRCGYGLLALCAGRRGADRGLRRVKNSFNSYPLGRIAQAGATASVRDEAHFREICARVIAGRDAMTRELIKLGFAVLPSTANFGFARHPARGGSNLAAALSEYAVLVRHFSKPRTTPYLRITVGSEDDTRRLIAAAVDVLAWGISHTCGSSAVA